MRIPLLKRTSENVYNSQNVQKFTLRHTYKKKPKPLCFVLIPAEALNALNEPKSKKPNMQYTPELIPN